MNEISSGLVLKYVFPGTIRNVCLQNDRHPELFEIELDVLYSYIASSPVAEDYAILVQRIARNELPHGADIVLGIHTRLLRDRRPFSLGPAAPNLPFRVSTPPASVAAVASANANNAPASGAKHVTCPVLQGARSGSGSSESIPSVSPQPVITAVPTASATLTNKSDAGGGKQS